MFIVISNKPEGVWAFKPRRTKGKLSERGMLFWMNRNVLLVNSLRKGKKQKHAYDTDNIGLTKTEHIQADNRISSHICA